MNKLPTKQSALLRLAVADAKKVGRRVGYELEMSEWHTPGFGGSTICLVCMAGAVMVCELAAESWRDLSPGDFGPETGRLLEDINNMRRGYFGGAPPQRAAAAMVRREHNFVTERAPWSVYLKAANILEAAGL